MPNSPSAIRPAVFLDRDGTLNEPPPPGGYVLRVEDLRLAPGAAEATRLLKDAGYFLALITNQRCVGIGLLAPETLDAIHDRLQSLLRDEGGAPLDAIYSCPDDRDSPRRKPSPTMLLEAARQHGLDLARSWMIGDSTKDVGAALAADVRPILVEHPGTASDRKPLNPLVEAMTIRAPDVLSAARVVLKRAAKR